jgi:hypothetical protein
MFAPALDVYGAEIGSERRRKLVLGQQIFDSQSLTDF